jgi:REP element-mobilizing transposase RayT
VHVTLRARLSVLRSEHVFPTVRLALLRAARRDETKFRVLQFSVQSDHVHLIVEASDKRSLTRGMQSLAIRVARYVNELLARRGAFWADRWHARALRTPREMRHALVYVLANFRKHTRVRGVGIDPFSSGECFDGWRVTSGVAPPLAVARRWAADPSLMPLVSEPRSWLARSGWRRHGLIGIWEAPAAARCG